MTQGIRTDRRPMPAAQDETQTDDALNAAVVRLLTRPESTGPTEMAEPAEPAARVQGIDATLYRAVEAHRDEVERQMREGAETDGDVDADMDRLVALADVIRATPTPTLADLRHKMIYLWAGKWPESGFFDGELRSTLDSIRRDIMKLADADTNARAASRPDPFADPNLHQGFIPMPAYRPTIFMNIQLAIPLEAQRLLDVAQAAFEQRVPAYSGFPQEERDAHIARMRAEYRLDQLEVLTWAEPYDEPVASQPPTDETIDSAIAAHRLARMQLDQATRGADEVAVDQDGGDISDEAMAGARSAWQAAHETEEAAFETVLALRPHAPAGLAAMLRYIAETPALGELDSSAEAMRQMAQAAEAVAASSARGAKLSQSQVRKVSGPPQRDIAAGSPALPSAASGPHPDAALLALATDFHTAHRAFEAASEAHRAMEAALEVDMPKRPDALRRRGDFKHFYGLASNPRSPDFYDRGEALAFRDYAPNFATFCVRAREAACARAAEIATAQEDWEAACSRYSDRTELSEADANADEALDLRFALGVAVEKLRATTLDGMVAKAKVGAVLDWDGFDAALRSDLLAMGEQA